MMLSNEEANKFLSEQLQLTHRNYSSDSTPTFDELSQIVQEFHMKIPFQNIALLAKARGTQDVPSDEEIKRDLLQGFGGLCYTNNVFMTHLLKALGLDAHHLAGTCNPKHPNNHILSLIKNLTTHSSLHLVDVGCGYPTYQVIPVDFEHESPIYTSTFLRYKYLREGGKLTRVHLQDFRDGIPGENSERDSWERFYNFDLIPRDRDHFQAAMSEVYSDRFLRKLRLLIFQEDAMVVVKEIGDKATLLKLTRGGTESTDLRTDEEIVATLHDLAPVFDEDVIKAAVRNWRYFKDLK